MELVIKRQIHGNAEVVEMVKYTLSRFLFHPTHLINNLNTVFNKDRTSEVDKI